MLNTSMGESLLSRRDRLIVAKHEVPGYRGGEPQLEDLGCFRPGGGAIGLSPGSGVWTFRELFRPRLRRDALPTVGKPSRLALARARPGDGPWLEWVVEGSQRVSRD